MEALVREALVSGEDLNGKVQYEATVLVGTFDQGGSNFELATHQKTTTTIELVVILVFNLRLGEIQFFC